MVGCGRLEIAGNRDSRSLGHSAVAAGIVGRQQERWRIRRDTFDKERNDSIYTFIHLRCVLS
jgi:hypothetical protein